MLKLRAAIRGRRDQADSSGFTLIELLICMIVFSIAMVIVTKAVNQVQLFVRDAQGSADANSEGRLALADIDRQVRSGNVLYSPANETSPSTCTAIGTDAGTCMRVYTQANGLERCVQWQVLPDGTTGTNLLRVRSWSPTWQTDGKYTSWTTRARKLVNVTGTPPFKLQGAATASSSRFLVVQFEAKDPRRPGKSVVINSALSGRNTNYGYDAGLCSPAPPG